VNTTIVASDGKQYGIFSVEVSVGPTEFKEILLTLEDGPFP
jgi:hypothetical protein